MFQDSLLTEKPRNRWLILLSATLQTSLVAVVLAAPLVFIEKLNPVALVSSLMAPPPPAPKAAVKPLKAISGAATSNSQFSPTRLSTTQRQFRLVSTDFRPTGVNLADIDAPDGLSDPMITGGTGKEAGIAEIGGLNKLDFRTPADPPKVKQNQVVRRVVGGAVQQALCLSCPKPTYPTLARSMRISGAVILNALIDTDGRVIGVAIKSGHPLLQEAAKNAASQWQYRPTLLNGQPVQVATTITLHFTLQ
jgi:periplasmic protein TonB